ncbi:FAD-binding oxidoreductase [Arthrobacter sp. H35-D1]|uniref:FAD-binding oxidoreductase n=1 Tax=Arthrobacter sp. H35-D1 TaxID=3046202 RepID=UPI0024B9C0FA|nr:FAD-binding oxidoreductase [Arthrobacter sp. H35-D1]MDJ0314700.1 FAD-binding oxidoreductase [Arthrobacter sp. H35-D1]
MTQQIPEKFEYKQLAALIEGEVIVSGDPGYDDARRVWNAMIDKYPVAVIRIKSTADIGPSLAFARKHGLLVAVRGGGHNVAGHGTVDGGLVIDLSACRDVVIDVHEQTVTVGAGATLHDLDAACSRYGLAVPVGVVSATGIAGLTLGGGFGWLTRAHGLTIDNLLAAELITANGQSVHASHNENPELLWALKGGGGNFGIVTSFTFQAHPLPETVLTGNLIYRQPHWNMALSAYASWTSTLPDEMTTIVTLLTPPPDWQLGTDPVLVIGFAWTNPDHQAGQGYLQALTSAAPPSATDVSPTPWPAWQSAVDDIFPKGVRAYWKNTGLRRLDGAAISTIIRFAAEQTWQGTAFDLHHMGGAFGRAEESATAFPDRGAPFWINIYGFWSDPADDGHHVDFVRRLASAMEPFSTGAQYLNFMATERDVPTLPPLANAAPVYGTEKLSRLRSLKHQWDPENTFRINHNIKPASVDS